MVADLAIHDESQDGNNNIHAHIMTIVRPLNEDGTWGQKSKKEYMLDENGEKILGKNGKPKTRKVELTNWNDRGNVEKWREFSSNPCNRYLQTGKFTEEFFPKSGVRYIAVNDGVDTNQDNNEIVPFKNVLNEFYSRDVSKKMKSAYYTRAKQGKFTGCLAPFGYKKDENNPHLLVIDEETSWIVEKIFDYAARGYGVQYIRTLLREEKIPTPT